MPDPFLIGRAAVRTAVALVAAPLVAFADPHDSVVQPEPATGRIEKPAVYAARHMVAAAHPLAAQAGLDILRAGGSAMDAAVTVQLVLGLVEPQSSGIGGGAFLLHWSAKERRLRSYDGRETAPQAARADRFLDAEGRPLELRAAVASGLSVGVPGALRMLELAHWRHGRLPWRALVAPAIRIAERGFAVSPRLHKLLAQDVGLRDDPEARRLFYAEDGRALPVGAIIRNVEYAATLRSIAERGADALYSGAVADAIVRAVRLHRRPGDLTRADLAHYRPLERTPLCGEYRGRRVCGVGPPSAGGLTVLQILGILERVGFDRTRPESADAVHLLSEAARLAYADRARYVADPAFVAVPVDGMLAASYLDARAKLVGSGSIGIAPPGRPEGAPAAARVPETESAGTSHFSIVDRVGDAVAMTSSIEHAFGSRIMVRGFLLNNQLTDFAFVPAAEGLVAVNRVGPGKRPRSGMAPTMVFGREGGLQMILGSPGGVPIALYVAKTLVAVIDWDLDIQQAVSLPNFGSTNGSTLIERGTPYENLAKSLAERGHVVEITSLTSGVHGIESVPAGADRGPSSGGWRGGADPRREGVVRGD
jgi:gamma-glutamyltranspeptidase/glutathione hydrolase